MGSAGDYISSSSFLSVPQSHVCYTRTIIAVPHIRKTASLYIYIYLFLSTITFQLLFHFRGRRLLFLFNGVLFPQKILKELILLCMDYDVALRLENVESQKEEVMLL